MRPHEPALQRRGGAAREPAAGARRGPLRPQRRQPPGLARGRRRGSRHAQGAGRALPAQLARLRGAHRRWPRRWPTRSSTRAGGARSSAPTSTRSGWPRCPCTSSSACGCRPGRHRRRPAAPEHRRRRLGLPVRAEPAAGAARRGPRRRDDDPARARRGGGPRAARDPEEIALAAHIGVGHRADAWPKQLARRPVEEFAFAERWGEPLGSRCRVLRGAGAGAAQAP